MRFLALLLITLSFSAVAQVYKWTDENGVTHFGTQPPPGQRQAVDVKPASGSGASSDGGAESLIIRQARNLEREKRAEEVRRYSSQSSSEPEKPENSWSCKYERERVEEYKILLRELGRKGYRQSEKDRLESRLRAAERQAERDCN